jgi:hypothetical protein
MGSSKLGQQLVHYRSPTDSNRLHGDGSTFQCLSAIQRHDVSQVPYFLTEVGMLLVQTLYLALQERPQIQTKGEPTSNH